MVVTPLPSSPLLLSGSQQMTWTRRIRKSDVYISSLEAIRARIEALRPLWRDGWAASIVPITQATCSPLYLCLEVDESLALEQLGPSVEYELCSAPLGERDAALYVFSVAQLLSRLHSEGVVHGHLHAGVVWRHTRDALRLVVTECELPMSALVPHGRAGSEARQCAAPEVLRGDPYAAAADVWGLGVLVLQLLMGSSKPVCTADLVDSDLLSPFISALSPCAASFVLPCLKSSPQARPLLLEVLQHPFLASALQIDGREDSDDQSSDGGSDDQSRDGDSDDQSSDYDSDDSTTSEVEEMEDFVADST
ncbi:hypothetical protein LSCM4_01665 [Leishmania orientalis]|uniref:Protein kinase domain-containing protein n=1 Tax=Leishmania orientalis TaxID=2249476 RepID=A0A836G554_9TRYP|nr:hypothetical protein LSCM4_01665 [Leishmania orientalis]